MCEDLYGRLLCIEGEVLGKRYRVIDTCSSGAFSNVYVCHDMKNQEKVIVKGYKQQSYFKDSAMREIAIMKVLNKLDVDQSLYIQYFGSFIHQGHLCVVLEKFGPTLFDALKMRGFRPLNSIALRIIMYKLCQAVKVLHNNGIIHTDLKPENILLPVDFDGERHFDIFPPSDAPSDCTYSSSEEICVGINNSKSGENAEVLNSKITSNATSDNFSHHMSAIDIRLIDFGSSAKSDRWHHNLATTRQYRAPEILMGTQWGVECDIWSLGCILVELALGEVEFDSKNDLEHLFLIQHMISPLPADLCRKTSNEQLRNSLCGNLINPKVFDKASRNAMMQKPTLFERLSFDEDLTDIALKMLNPNQFERPTIDEILEHRFFKSY